MAEILQICRYSWTPDYTESVWFVRRPASARPEGVPEWERICYGIERPWKDNRPNISCIPGNFVYDFRQHKRPNGQSTYMLLGGSLVASPDQIGGDYTRWGILIHPANRASELEGCLAPGTDRQRGVVVGSRDAMARLHEILVPYFSQNEYGQVRVTDWVPR